MLGRPNDDLDDERIERFRRLFGARYQPPSAYARRRTAAADADDLVADVLATAWRRLDDIPAGSELPWLYGVARRSLANQRRGAARRLRLLVRLAQQPGGGAPTRRRCPHQATPGHARVSRGSP